MCGLHQGLPALRTEDKTNGDDYNYIDISTFPEGWIAQQLHTLLRIEASRARLQLEAMIFYPLNGVVS